MTLEEFYDRIGSSYHAVFERIPSEAMIRKFVRMYEKDPSFSDLVKYTAEENWKDAFRAAHTLKGVAQNLGFERLQAEASAVTEALRPGVPLADRSMLDRVREAHEEVLTALRALEG